jgi:hypothetical protein
MIESTIHTEGEWLASQDKTTKALFLASLGHAITIVGRNSYPVEGEGLDHPWQLRTVNEIQHRVLACLREVLADLSSDSFQRSIATWVLEQPDPELHRLLSWAWNGSKEKAS